MNEGPRYIHFDLTGPEDMPEQEPMAPMTAHRVRQAFLEDQVVNAATALLAYCGEAGFAVQLSDSTWLVMGNKNKIRKQLV